MHNFEDAVRAVAATLAARGLPATYRDHHVLIDNQWPRDPDHTEHQTWLTFVGTSTIAYLAKAIIYPRDCPPNEASTVDIYTKQDVDRACDLIQARITRYT